MSYLIDEHKHRFSAWAAGNAASVKGCRFSVEQGKAILDGSALRGLLERPNELPIPGQLDAAHRAWRHQIVQLASMHGLTFTHGVAAKLINVYLKAAFVCGGHHSHPHVHALHPPIDSVLLGHLEEKNVGNLRTKWHRYGVLRWSRFDSGTYEAAIADIRDVLPPGRPLWAIEEFWKGHQ